MEKSIFLYQKIKTANDDFHVFWIQFRYQPPLKVIPFYRICTFHLIEDYPQLIGLIRGHRFYYYSRIVVPPYKFIHLIYLISVEMIEYSAKYKEFDKCSELDIYSSDSS